MTLTYEDDLSDATVDKRRSERRTRVIEVVTQDIHDSSVRAPLTLVISKRLDDAEKSMALGLGYTLHNG